MHQWINPETQGQPESLTEYVSHTPVMLVMLSFLGVAALVLLVMLISL